MKKVTLTLIFVLLLTSCVKVPGETATNVPPLFVTSTLPPTKQALTLPTPLPPTASPTADPLTPPPAPCRDSALFVEDVTYPDNAHLESGEIFTKTWKFQNVGACTWTNYTVAFVSGDKMDSAESVPVPETEAHSTVEVSIDLVAPSTDGAYVGNFELHNADGENVPMGSEPTFWVKVIVGEGGGTSAEQSIGNCTYNENPEFVQTLIDLINKARADVGRVQLTVNTQLTERGAGTQLGYGLQRLRQTQRLRRYMDWRPPAHCRLSELLLFGTSRHRASTRCNESMAH